MIFSPSAIGTLLTSVTQHERAYNDATGNAAKLGAADSLIHRYSELVEALRPRLIEAEHGATVAVTLADLDIHVNVTDARITVCVGTDDLTPRIPVYVESWDGLSWECEITGHHASGPWWNEHHNQIGDWCPHSGKPAPGTRDEDDRCPAGCPGSYASDEEPA